MPILPSGRRIEFSLDRFHLLLRQVPPEKAQALAASLDEPNDLLFVMDTVVFGREDGMPFFAGCMASDWMSYAADWTTADRQALLAWFASEEARARRAEAIDYIKTLVFDHPCRAVSYPYVLLATSTHPGVTEGSRLLQ